MITSEKIINLIMGKRYVSFDMFDTLIVRDVLQPSDIFKIVEVKIQAKSRYNIDDFAKKRIEAEKRAICKSSNPEISLDNIYSEIDIENDEERDFVKQLEINTEFMYCRINPEFIPVLEYCKKNNINILIITDTYFPKKIITKILKENNIFYDYLFVSSDLQKRKSRGEMYKYVMDFLNVNKNEIIHIGDNYKSDYLQPKLHGISAIHYNRKKNKENMLFVDKVISAHLQNNNISIEKPYYKVGYECFGPALFGFCQWINKLSLDNDFDEICFFARDGKIVKTIYDKLYISNTKYIYASRRSLTVPLLISANSFVDVYNTVPYIKRNENIKDLLHKLGIEDQETINKVKKLVGEEVTREFLLGTQGESLFEIIKDKMHENAKNELLMCKQYFEENLSGKKIAVVDIGWYGTMQKSLQNILNLIYPEHSYSIMGLYFGLLSRNNGEDIIENAQGYVYSEKEKKFDSELVFGFNGLIETFFTANHGSTKKYLLEDENIAPVLEPFESENEFIVNQIQKGAIEFAENTKELICDFELDVHTAYSRLEMMMKSPNNEQIRIFGDILFYDVSLDKLISSRGLFYYMFHLRDLIRDYLKSNWKIGFLKKTLHLPLISYYKIFKVGQKFK